MQSLRLFRPRDLREALGNAFVHRTAVRWRAGNSAILSLAYDRADGGAAVVDVRDVSDFHTVRSDPKLGISIGAFASADALRNDPAVARAIGAVPLGPPEARFRLAALGAQLVIAGPGATRTAALDGFDAGALPAHEIPVAVTLRPGPPQVWFGDRRIRRRDGAASFELRVHVALSLAGPHRIGRALVAYALDGGPPIPLAPVNARLRDVQIAKTTFAEAARTAADSFRGDDERTNVLRRTIMPLLLSALGDAYGAARANGPERPRR